MQRLELSCDKKFFLEKLFEEYMSFIWYSSYKVLHDKGLTEDAVQQTCERIICAVDTVLKIEGEEAMKGFIYVVARNNALTLLKKKQKDSVCCNIADYEYCLSDVNTNIENTVVNQVCLKQKIHALKPIHKITLYLRYKFDLPYKQIAEITQVTESNARMRVSKALTALKSKLLE